MRPAKRVPRAILAMTLTLATGLLGAPRAEASVELWNQFETKVDYATERSLMPDSFNFQTDVRFSSRFTGLERVQLRWGPRWKLGGPLTLGLNHTAYLQQPDPGVFIQEQRLEAEPVLAGELGPLNWRDRNRLELRWRPDQTRWRYRNQLRVEHPLGGGWVPFVADEVFVQLVGPAFDENRITLGLARESEVTGWEIAYTYRTRHGTGASGEPDHLFLWVWYNALERAPLGD